MTGMIEFSAPVGNQPDPHTELQKDLAKFDVHFTPKKNVVADRHRWRNCVQQTRE